MWEQYQEVRDTALKSKAYGFYFDTTPVFNEISALNAVSDEYRTSIETGSVDPDTAIAEFNQKLYDAGLQNVMDEKQAQLDEWLAQKQEPVMESELETGGIRLPVSKNIYVCHRIYQLGGNSWGRKRKNG